MLPFDISDENLGFEWEPFMYP